MNHIMLDLETLGTSTGCAIISIGAVAFDPTEGTGWGFYKVVNQQSCKRVGLTTDDGTIAWWLRQSDDAKKVLIESRSGGLDINDALDEFSKFVKNFPSEVRVWGCGADFDNAILSHCYASVNKKIPWNYINNRCYRTLRAIVPHIKIERSGTYHNAYDDAVSQAEHAIRIMDRIAEVKP